MIHTIRSCKNHPLVWEGEKKTREPFLLSTFLLSIVNCQKVLKKIPALCVILCLILREKRFQHSNLAHFCRVIFDLQWRRYRQEHDVTIKNNTGKDIYIFQEGSRNGTRISANGSGSGDCTKSLYYSFTGKSELNGNGSKFYSGNASCGGNINVN